MLLVFVLALTSCDALLGTPDTGDGTDNVEGTVVWSPDTAPVIVTDESESDLYALVDHVATLTDKTPAVVATSSDAVANEIVVGDSEREITRRAKIHLDVISESLEYEGDEKSSYVIYALDGSLAVVYTNIYARDAAINYMLANCKDSTTAFENGVVTKTIFDTVDFITAYRKAEQEKIFVEMDKELGADAVNYLRDIYSLYDTDLYIWLANLYDPAVGGFYYSNSARATHGFLPDIESTMQALRLVDNANLSGAYEGSWTKMFSEEIEQQLIDFARGLQNENGYFYHPQWGKAISSSRRGRDLGWSTQLLTALGAKPKYDTPNGVKGDSAAPTAKQLTGDISLSSVTAVSKVVAAADASSTPAEFQSKEAFRAYLENMKINRNSYSAGNTLSARSGEIQAAGYLPELRAYLAEIQNPINGLWEDEISYNAINGLMKLCTLFADFPNADAAIESTLTIMSLPMDEDVETICFVYNPWVALYNVIQSCSDSKRVEVMQTLKSRASELFSKTYDKLAVFRKEDGGFSMNQEYSSTTSQGVIAAVAGSRESDVNATGIGISTVIKYMLKVYNIPYPSIYCKYDSIYFAGIMESLGPSLKQVTTITDPEVVTFKDYDPSIAEEIGGVVMYPHDSIQSVIMDSEMTKDDMYRWFRTAVIDDPTGSGDKVLYGAALKEPNNPAKQMAVSTCSTQLNIVNSAAVGNCYILDLDMYCKGGDDGVVLWIDFASINVPLKNDQSARIEVVKSTDENGVSTLTLSEAYYYPGGDREYSTLASGVPVGEWVHLRIELYKNYDEGGTNIEDMFFKMYINEEFVYECVTGRYTGAGGYIDHIVDCIRLGYYRYQASEWYFKNIYAAKEMKSYQPENMK